MIQAIETVYKGCKFRSRLEARWAVFFECLGLRWDYEPEGFQLSARKYLPDFWLPDHRMWVEIKPSFQEDVSHLHEFSRLSESRVFVFRGSIPDTSDDGYYLDEGAPYWCEQFFSDHSDARLPCVCPKCGMFGIEYNGWAQRLKCKCEKLGHMANYDDDRLLMAYFAARSARFEHEERQTGEFVVNGQKMTAEQLIALGLNRVKIVP